MAFFSNQGRQLYYERHGQGPALVMLHGAGSNAATWWQQLPDFSREHTCLILDQRCFGRAPAPRTEFRIEHFVADVLALLDHEGIDRASLLGQSLGGMVALRTALWHPQRVRQLVLCDTSLAIDHPLQLQILRERLHKVAALTVEQRSLGAWFLQHHPDRAALYMQINHFNPNVHQGRGAAWQAALNALNEPDQLTDMASLSHIDCPTLIVVGEHDPIVPVAIMQEVQSRIRGCQLQVIEHAAHSAYFERPDRFNPCVLDFLRGY